MGAGDQVGSQMGWKKRMGEETAGIGGLWEVFCGNLVQWKLLEIHKGDSNEDF